MSRDPLSPARGILLGLVVGLAMWLVVAVAVYATPVPADARLQVLDDELGLFLASKGYGTPEAPVFLAADEFFDELLPNTVDGKVIAAAGQEGTLLRAEVAGWVALPDSFGALVNVLIHEKLHRRQGTTPVALGWDDTDRTLEEAAVEAAARDLTAAFMERRYPWVDHFDFDSFYPRLVAMVRSCSARAVRRSWRSERAQLWRRGFWRASAERRRGRILACGVKL